MVNQGRLDSQACWGLSVWMLPRLYRCPGFPRPKDVQMRQTGDCKLALGEIQAFLFLRDPAKKLSTGRDPALNPKQLEWTTRRAGEVVIEWGKNGWMDANLSPKNIKCFAAATMRFVFIVFSELRRFYYVEIVGVWDSPMNGGIMTIVVRDDLRMQCDWFDPVFLLW